jgi:DNA-binding MarR family transcriptional regulator
MQSVKNFRVLLRRFERELFMQNTDSCCNGVTLAQCHTLLEIESKGKGSLTELANILGLDKSTVSRTVDGLVNVGLVDRTIPAENRRMATLQLTNSGKNMCNSINQTNDKYFADILSILTPAEKSEFPRLLEKVVNRMVELRSSVT